MAGVGVTEVNTEKVAADITAPDTFSRQIVLLGKTGLNAAFDLNSSFIVKPTVTGSTTPAYSLNDVIGGKLTLTAAMRTNNGTGVLQSMLAVDTANVKPTFDLLLFSQDLAGTYTDNAAFTLNATDAGNLVRRVSVGAADWVTIGGTLLAVADIPAISRVVRATNTQANLYAVLVATATFTLTSTTQLSLSFGFLQD